MVTPFDWHADLGFGAVADAFRDAANAVLDAPPESRGLNEHLPASFLYRHAIELYLKSGVIIFHRLLRLPYGDAPWDSEPQVSVGGKWRPMYRVHALGQLYPYWRSLFSEHSDYLERHTRVDWSFPPELDAWVTEIESRDSTSTFFRYPVTRHRTRDPEKDVNREDAYGSIVASMTPGGPYVKAFVVIDEDDEIIRSSQRDEEPARSTLQVLRKTCEVFADCHAAMRGELTDGW